MRIFHYKLHAKDGEGLTFTAEASRPASAAITLAGVIMLSLVPFVEASELPLIYTAVLVFPACGLIMSGLILLGYRSRTVICPLRRQVTYHELLAGLPLRRLDLKLDDFSDITPSIAQTGREARRNVHVVVILAGERKLPLLDVDGYPEALELCRELKAAFGFGR